MRTDVQFMAAIMTEDIQKGKSVILLCYRYVFVTMFGGSNTARVMLEISQRAESCMLSGQPRRCACVRTGHLT